MSGSKPIDLSGRRFGSLVAQGIDGRTKHGSIIWRCTCDCGFLVSIAGPDLRAGRTTSCGCQKSAKISEARRTHGESHSIEYQTWSAMKARCANPNNPAYPHYGGRGIKVCRRWLNSYGAFLKDMGRRPSPLHSIERKSNKRGYTPANCTWALRGDQMMNKRDNHVVTLRGESKIVAEWSRVTGVKASTIRARLLKGWSPARALA